jgi:RimJ/RimL family protein N-acetyltransferase
MSGGPPLPQVGPGSNVYELANPEGALQVINYHIQAEPTSEQRDTLLAQAQSDWSLSGRRSWRPGRRFTASRGRTVLRDGSEVLIRQVRRTDVPLLADGFSRLSAKSRQMRFLGPKKELTPAELRYLTDIDHHDHEALGAVDHADGRGVGVARYVRSADDPQAADIPVTVVDEWQGRGLGTELVARLSDRARAEGIRRFTALR